MALRDQPYIPLYVNDFLGDEKLIDCSPAATGIYIKIMCILHKGDPYGTFLLKQKFKQTESATLNFAEAFAKHLPWDVATILAGLEELLNEKILYVDGDQLFQKRMLRDGAISATRSLSGKIGVETKKAKIFAEANGSANTSANMSANTSANTENENGVLDSIKEIRNPVGNLQVGESPERGDDLAPGAIMLAAKSSPLVPQMVQVFKKHFPSYPDDPENDYPACLKISGKISKPFGWTQEQILNGKMTDLLAEWEAMVCFGAADEWFATRSIRDYDKEFQRLSQKFKNHGKSGKRKTTDQRILNPEGLTTGKFDAL